MGTTTIIASVFAIFGILSRVHSHGAMTYPRQRGMMRPDSQIGLSVLDPKAEPDYCSHCNNGGGKAAVFQATNGNWKLYEPLKQGFKFAAGLCGDPLRGPLEHQKGGKFYNGGKKVATYKRGQVIDFQLTINAHHNGYSEFYICNLDRCGTDDIDAKCFRNGSCRKLNRVKVDSCESGNDKGCGPIDEKYPGRWYLPCKDGSPWQFFGGKNGKMRYRLPNDLTCKNCVIQWYWATANSCNPRGMKEYFTGKNKPNWGQCAGDGGSSGGAAINLGECGGNSSPEEFWGCADVSISADGSAPEPMAAPQKPKEGDESREEPEEGQQPNSSGPTPSPGEASPTPANTVPSTPPAGKNQPGNGSCAQKWNPCGGGANYSGPIKCCDPNYTCFKINRWISLCQPRG